MKISVLLLNGLHGNVAYNILKIFKERHSPEKEGKWVRKLDVLELCTDCINLFIEIISTI